MPIHPAAGVLLPLMILVGLPSALRAGPPIDSEAVARKLLETTVTVRIATPKSTSDEPTAGLAAGLGGTAAMRNNVDSIYLASGVSLGRGMIVTFSNSPGSARYRATLPDGQQADAELRVADDYSGLRLIEIDKHLPGLELCSEPLAIGMPVMTAAAMGIEKPVVSLGILGGSDRLLGGSGLPPLLVCDVHSSETSSGAAMVDREGKLVGVVAAASDPAQRVGWTYAVPVRHVQRLIAARVDKQQVVLRRQRPTAGLTLGQGPREGTVRVERVDAGGPADRAGIKSGDLVLDVEGHKIRSAYQAVDLILKKQAGDKVQFLVEHSGRSRTVDLTLGGVLAPLMESRQPLESTVQVGPQVNVTLVRPNEIEVRRGATAVDEIKVDPNAPPTRTQRDEMGALKAQLATLEQVIAELRQEVRRREEAQGKTAELIKSLQAEIEQLRKQPDKP